VSLPDADRAVVEDAKVRDYLLSPTHPVGRFKSVFFAALGFSADHWSLLRDALLELARTGDATLRNWEQDRRSPEGPALALLRIAARHPRILRENLKTAA